MTKKLKILLISVLFLVATVCVCLFAGCKVKYTVDELKEKYGLTAQITYFINGDGGEFGNEIYVKDLYYKTGALPMDIGNTGMVSGSSKMTINKGYKFLGWYKVEIDETTGKPFYADRKGTYTDGDKYDVKRGMANSGNPFDFTKPLEEGDHFYLCGEFEGSVKVDLRLLCEEFGDEEFDQITYKDNDKEVTVKNGDRIEYGCIDITQTGIEMPGYSRELQGKLTGYTIVDFYQYDDSTEQYTPIDAINYPEPNDEGKRLDVVVYLKVLKGEWQILSSYTDVKTMFNWGDEQYYLQQDIDCGGKAVSNLSSFSGTLYGGKTGHTIKNFVVQGDNDLGMAEKASMFGTIEGSAVIKNVTFENVTVKFTIARRGTTQIDANVKFIANEIQSGATFNNFIVSGSLNIKFSSAYNAVTSTTQDDWLFGDKNDATFKEITVTQATCTIVDHNDVTVNTFTFNNNNQTEDLS